MKGFFMDLSKTVPEPVLLRINEAAKMLAISPRSVYHLVQSGQLKINKIGRSSRIATADVRAFAARIGTAK